MRETEIQFAERVIKNKHDYVSDKLKCSGGREGFSSLVDESWDLKYLVTLFKINGMDAKIVPFGHRYKVIVTWKKDYSL